MSKGILLITEDPALAESISALLAGPGYRTDVCPRAKDAVAEVSAHRPDLIICDDKIPTITGRELARLFKSHEELSLIPFLLLTAHLPSVTELEKAGLRVLADDIVHLPLDEPKFLETVAYWLALEEPPRTLAERMTGPLSGVDRPQDALPWNRGRSSCATIGRLLYRLYKDRSSGVLRLKGERRMLHALIHEGNLVDVKSNYIRDDTLGRFLLDLKRITPKANELSLKTALQENISQGQVLVRMELLDDAELDFYTAQQKIAKMTNLFEMGWNESVFEFHRETIAPNSFTMKPAPLARILTEGLFQIAEIEELQRIISEHRKESLPIRLDERFAEVAADLDLDEDTRDLAGGLAGVTVNQVMTREPEEEAARHLRLAFLLIITEATYFDESKARRAAGEADEARSAGSWNVEAYQQALTKARTFFNRDDFKNARPHLFEALKHNPESSPAMAMLAWTNHQLGKDNLAATYEAKEMLKKALSLDDTNDLALLYLGRIFKLEGKDSLAKSYFRRAGEVNPANDEARHEVKLLQIKQRKSRGQDTGR
jgi:CheY-like chemotaxis protein